MKTFHTAIMDQSRRRYPVSMETNPPLETDQLSVTTKPHYYTFSRINKHKEHPSLCWSLLMHFAPFIHHHSSLGLSRQKLSKPTEFLQLKRLGRIIVTVAFIAILGYFYQVSSHNRDFTQQRWIWDHNVYYSQNTTQNSQNLLIAQVTSPRMREYVEISSLPNRAYARQWKRDYVRVYASEDDCSVDTASLVYDMVQRQQESHTGYDVILILPSDAVIMKFDSDLIDWLPKNKLLAIAGWIPGDSFTSVSNNGILLLNSRHAYAKTVAEVWLDLVSSESTVSCGIPALLEAVESVLEDDEHLSGFLIGLNENDKGFVADRTFKLIPRQSSFQSFMFTNTNAEETRIALEMTTASVCYRYYPRCDVLLD